MKWIDRKKETHGVGIINNCVGEIQEINEDVRERDDVGNQTRERHAKLLGRMELVIKEGSVVCKLE